MTTETLCRLAEKHWCVDCCFRSGIPCYGLGRLTDGSKGCLVYDGPDINGIHKPPLCDDFNCLTLCGIEDPAMIVKIRQTIVSQPPGEFKMTFILLGLGLL